MKERISVLKYRVVQRNGKFEIIRKKTKETYKTLFDPENVFYKSGNFIRHHHFLKITSVKCCPFHS
jgi:hypothetical protein